MYLILSLYSEAQLTNIYKVSKCGESLVQRG